MTTTAYFIGTSYTAGTGGSPVNLYPTTMSALMGWTPTVDGVGGSGYTVPTLFIDRLPALIAAAPDVVVVEGAASDQPDDSPATVAALLAAAQAFFTQLRAGLPDAVIHGTAAHRRYNDVAAGLRNIVRGVGGTFTDWADPADPWLTGTGNVGNPQGDGNKDWYLGADNAHLTSAGYIFVGSRWAWTLGARYVSGLTDESGVLLSLGEPA